MHSKFFPALQGTQSKMSASDANSAIYLTDSPAVIKNKINKHAVSGGRETEEEHRRLGAVLEVEVPIMYLEFFLEDDAQLDHIRTEYKAGRMLTGEVKKILIDLLCDITAKHQKQRAAVTEEMIDAFMAVRKMG